MNPLQNSYLNKRFIASKPFEPLDPGVPVFADEREMKRNVRNAMMKNRYNVHDADGHFRLVFLCEFVSFWRVISRFF